MEPTAPSLARTYSDRVYSDPWEKVLDYRRVQAYAAEHPNHGRARVGNALELPPGRIRGWLNDGIPDPVRGIQTAIDYGWLEPEPDSEMTAALVELLAHVLAGGSITKTTYVPAVTIGERVGRAAIESTFDRLGVETVIRHADTDGRATEITPSSDASVLGRCLVTMGAPTGTKAGLDTFPALLEAVPNDVQRSFAQVYVAHRANTFPQKETMTIYETRSQAYLSGVGELIKRVTGEEVTVGERGITISAAATRALEAT